MDKLWCLCTNSHENCNPLPKKYIAAKRIGADLSENADPKIEEVVSGQKIHNVGTRFGNKNS